MPAEGNGDLQTLICVLVARPRLCLTLSNPVPRQNWMAAYLGYTLWMKTLFCGWPVMVNDTQTKRRSPYRLENVFIACQHTDAQYWYSKSVRLSVRNVPVSDVFKVTLLFDAKYLTNCYRYGHSYYRKQVGNCTQAFEWHQFQWPRVTSNPDFKVTTWLVLCWVIYMTL